MKIRQKLLFILGILLVITLAHTMIALWLAAWAQMMAGAITAFIIWIMWRAFAAWIPKDTPAYEDVYEWDKKHWK